MRHIRNSGPKSAVISLKAALVLGTSLVSPEIAQAACNSFAPANGQTATCDATSPNPVTTGVYGTAGSSGVTIDILGGAIVNIVRAPTANAGARVVDSSTIVNSGAISLTGSGSSGLNRGAGLVGTGSNNSLTNNGSISTTGQYNDGMAADGSGNTLTNNGSITTTGPNAYGMTASWGQSGGGSPNNTIINNGTVSTAGSNARAVSILGANGSVTNTGTLTTSGNSSPTVYIQGGNGTLINSGTIHASGGAASGGLPSDGVFSNTLGSTFNATIVNLAGGQIISDQGPAIRTLNGQTSITNAGLLNGGNGFAISGGNGNISLTLQTGSKMIGTANGGGGSNMVTLQGEGLIDNAFTNFQTLYMTGTDWIWAGTGDFHDSFIENGTFQLQSDLTGNVTVSSGASLLAGGGFNPSITPYPGGSAVTLTNSGVIDLTNGGSQTMNSLTVVGNYVGSGGSLLLDTVLGGDGSASDKLVIDGGAASGSTAITVNNFGGGGAATMLDGINVVEATNGATASSNAFYLNGRAAAGAYEYYLFKGGVSAGTSNNWYLRSAYVAPVPTPDDPDPEGPILIPTTNGTSGIQPPLVTPGDPAPTPPNSGATPISPEIMNIGGVDVEVIPLIRPEVATYTAIPPAAQVATLATLGTFHERRGEQSVVTSGNIASAVWGRGFGEHVDQGWSGSVSPSIDGSLWGLQTGIDILRHESDSGHRDIAGLFFGYADLRADVTGQAVGWNNVKTGRINLDATSVGAYWTHIGPTGWYLDGVLMGTWYGGNANSIGGTGIDIDGSGFTASLEGGYPIALGGNWSLEPQAQLIWQDISLDDKRDAYSAVAFGSDTSWTGRVGARLQGNFQTSAGLLQPYLKTDIWHNFDSTDTVRFDSDAMNTSMKGTSMEVGGGVVYAVNTTFSVFATADYRFDVSGEHQRTFHSNVGLRMKW
ncbi:autotransporter family protein [Rhizobium multihospitium]|uniref:Outer membrane autotransporter barrel domain-containing protein n=1 Tax=Rhizobium multihospitium TaxID=410764 RepID=A0A1C3WYF8_9HYPH|nr:autotransporter outer membrane beta-barrel domain-containing protein [Rhizobium multihospitium]SCB45047.1 outer membrane autotransporter barrel domain-containing protein [Rhizobium multihospitium]